MFTGGVIGNDLEYPVSICYEFDLNTRQKTQIKEMHLPRYRHQLVLCKNSIYAIGGLARGKLATK